jgi:hypothetical protein
MPYFYDFFNYRQGVGPGRSAQQGDVWKGLTAFFRAQRFFEGCQRGKSQVAGQLQGQTADRPCNRRLQKAPNGLTTCTVLPGSCHAVTPVYRSLSDIPTILITPGKGNADGQQQRQYDGGKFFHVLFSVDGYGYLPLVCFWVRACWPAP